MLELFDTLCLTNSEIRTFWTVLKKLVAIFNQMPVFHYTLDLLHDKEQYRFCIIQIHLFENLEFTYILAWNINYIGNEWPVVP